MDRDSKSIVDEYLTNPLKKLGILSQIRNYPRATYEHCLGLDGTRVGLDIENDIGDGFWVEKMIWDVGGRYIIVEKGGIYFV